VDRRYRTARWGFLQLKKVGAPLTLFPPFAAQAPPKTSEFFGDRFSACMLLDGLGR
jgi:hypothetical protein